MPPRGRPAAVVDIDLQEQLWLGVDNSVEPLFFAIHFDLLLIDHDPPRLRRRWFILCLGERLFPFLGLLKTTIQDAIDFRSDSPI